MLHIAVKLIRHKGGKEGEGKDEAKLKGDGKGNGRLLPGCEAPACEHHHQKRINGHVGEEKGEQQWPVEAVDVAYPPDADHDVPPEVLQGSQGEVVHSQASRVLAHLAQLNVRADGDEEDEADDHGDDVHYGVEGEGKVAEGGEEGEKRGKVVVECEEPPSEP